MLLVNFSKVSKDYGGNAVFDEVDLEVLEGQRIGLVGENGAGKSTLFRLIAGLDTPVEGTVTKRRNLTVGYLHQEADPLQAHRSVYETVAGLSPEMLELATTMRKLEARMADPEETRMEWVLEAYGDAQGRFESLGGYTAEHRVEDVLGGLGFTASQYGQPVGTLSGGEKKLVSLARLLLEMPDLLLLDEPDNHLDLEAKGWLEGFIASYPGTVMIISHDRYLLDRVVKRIFELEDGQIGVYAGNYTFYAEERQRRLIQRHETYTMQQEELQRMEALLRQLRGWAKQNSKFAPRMRSMEKRVEKAREAASERPVMWREKIRVSFDSERSGRKVLEAKGLSQSVSGRVLFAPFDLSIQYGERVGIVGANGSGKTTLLKTITEALPPTKGTVKIGASVVLGYYTQEQETLPLGSTLMDFVRSLRPMTEQGAIGVLRSLLFSYREMHNKIRDLSGGEKSRLQIARLMLTDANFLVLDEPTNNLDIASIEVLESALGEFEGTLLTVSHDRYFLDRIVNTIVAIGTDGEVKQYPGNFSYYLEKRIKEKG
ncbi:MAG TPA: ABC-F family ATP-binding cassette domain-containing protein [Chloroflexia bacterium]|nr:ABC-F family ATP-binding cassette domain-containing protein [Chloroflexia bacterium]